MSLHNSYDRTAFLNELNSPLDTQEGVLSPAAQKARVLSNLMSGVTAGTVGNATTVEATERGDGVNYTTVLDLTAFAVGNSGDATSVATGALLYTFPAGDILVKDATIMVGLTLADAVQTDTPEIGLGTVVGSGANATLGAVGATSENIFEGVAVADVAGTVFTGYDQAGLTVGRLKIAAAGAHTVYLNVADGWANLTAASAITATGQIVINWTKL